MSSTSSVKGVIRPIVLIVWWMGVCVMAMRGAQDAGVMVPMDLGITLESGVEVMKSREAVGSWNSNGSRDSFWSSYQDFGDMNMSMSELLMGSESKTDESQ